MVVDNLQGQRPSPSEKILPCSALGLEKVEMTILVLGVRWGALFVFRKRRECLGSWRFCTASEEAGLGYGIGEGEDGVLAWGWS